METAWRARIGGGKEGTVSDLMSRVSLAVTSVLGMTSTYTSARAQETSKHRGRSTLENI